MDPAPKRILSGKRDDKTNSKAGDDHLEENYEWAYVGTEKIVGRGRQKSVTGWGVKIRLQGGGHFEQTGRG